MHQNNGSLKPSIDISSTKATSSPDSLSHPPRQSKTNICHQTSFRKAVLLLSVTAVVTLRNVSTSIVTSPAHIFNLEAANNVLMTAIGIGQPELDDNNATRSLPSPSDYMNNISTDDSEILSLADINVTLSSCRILIYSKTFDGHYEVFESIARKYPLPFSSRTNCQSAGLTPGNPIVVDFVMPFQWQGGYKTENNNNTTNKKQKKGKKKKMKMNAGVVKSSGESEGWGWTSYFQAHLQNSTAQRIDNSEKDDSGRYIYYANVLGLNKRSFQSIPWKSYSFVIEASCDMWGNAFWKDWLAKDKKRHYCVFHRKHERKKLAKSVEKRTCYLNPQFEEGGHCWFLPTVYPKFTKPEPPLTENNPKLNICIGWKSMGKGAHLLRDESLLVRALWKLSNTWNASVSNHQIDIPDKVQVLVIGRNARVPDAFVQAKLNRMVQVHNNLASFYEYQQLIATKCHALVPLVHPEQGAYFLTAPKSEGEEKGPEKAKAQKGQGRLSGMIAQLIGNRIPSLVHGAVADIYQHEFTAPFFMYNVTNDGGEAFQTALEGLINYYYYPRDGTQGSRLTR